ncbi:hypothetical protein, partial [Pseudomonas syringae group genomosp. 7]|uniref:hypothetical protein n=1 Tax=Pseudomonas syringae group genomosp. 7 TaxID=251699 RepID=UPI00376FFBF8
IFGLVSVFFVGFGGFVFCVCGGFVVVAAVVVLGLVVWVWWGGWCVWCGWCWWGWVWCGGLWLWFGWWLGWCLWGLWVWGLGFVVCLGLWVLFVMGWCAWCGLVGGSVWLSGCVV